MLKFLLQWLITWLRFVGFVAAVVLLITGLVMLGHTLYAHYGQVGPEIEFAVVVSLLVAFVITALNYFD